MDQANVDSLRETIEDLQPVRFNIKSLLLLTTACAVSVVIVDHFSIGGTVILFSISVAVSIWLWANSKKSDRRFWLEAIWGITMPLACIATDPFVFTETGPWDGLYVGSEGQGDSATLEAIRSDSAAIYGFIFWQMLMLVTSWFVTTLKPKLAAFLSGALFAGVAFAGLLASILFFPAVLFSLILIGLPGLTPVLTTTVFVGALKYCWKVADFDRNGYMVWNLAATGFGCSIVLALAVFLIWSLLF